MDPFTEPLIPEPTLPERPAPRPSRPLVLLAALATAVLVAALALALAGAGSRGSAAPASGSGVEVGSSAAGATTPTSATPSSGDDPAAASIAPVPPLPDSVDGDAGPDVVVPPAAPKPVAPTTTTPPPPPEPSTGPVLVAQDEYELDPGVDEVTITLQNQGTATLHYDITNDGDGFQAASTSGEIEAGGAADVLIEIDIAPGGDGPTPFELTVHVASDGGGAAVVIRGQVEKPGHLVAEFESLPFVDYRATVTFTNVGGLPLAIAGLDAPGLSYAPLPDEIGAGESLDVEVAICAGNEPLPVFVAHPNPPQPVPMFQVATWVTLETEANTESTQLHGWTFGFAPPSCETVFEPIGGVFGAVEP
jgi:hypothetical protein